jgi:hypothetical protein
MAAVTSKQLRLSRARQVLALKSIGRNQAAAIEQQWLAGR